jgi:hypothetical protein
MIRMKTRLSSNLGSLIRSGAGRACVPYRRGLAHRFDTGHTTRLKVEAVFGNIIRAHVDDEPRGKLA